MDEEYALSSYQYHLPEELIAQAPVEPRDHSRLMIVNRSDGSIVSTTFRTLGEMLQEGDQLIFNDTKVIPSRLHGIRKGGGKAEVFLIRRHQDGSWDALVRPGKKLPPGSIVQFNPSFYCEMLEPLNNGGRRILFHCQGDLDKMLEECAQIPLPHYIRRDATKEDKIRYQTVYAANPGAVAAPTAGLHFSHDLLLALKAKGVIQTYITLHTGIGTFRPVKTEDIRAHVMHAERYIIPPHTAEVLNSPGDRLRLCIGTTSCRTLEAAANEEGIIQAGEYDTNIFIYPGYRFKYVSSLLTNFHLPGSTLLMLVCAFAGRELVMEAYERAVRERFRFFSYGDAMLIL